jgi:microcystin-dependent protein
MANPFVGEIRIFPFNFAPFGWATCNGQLLPIGQNVALFSLLGTQYGGNGTSNFALPNLQGSFPINFGQAPGLPSYIQGESGGQAAVALLTTQIPAHTHTVVCAAAGNSTSPSGNAFGSEGRGKPPAYAPLAVGAAVVMSSSAVAAAGSSQPHPNMPPYLTLNFCIALQGIFPARG